MKRTTFATLLEKFFTDRLMRQRQVSSHTISSYRDTFRLLLLFAKKHLGKQPSRLVFEEIDAPLIVAFLHELEAKRKISPRTRNLRLTAIRSFFQYAAYEEPAHGAQIQRVLAIPGKKYAKKVVGFLERSEVDALLAAPDRQTWYGRRDHALMFLAVQTGLRLSELTGLREQDVHLGTGAHVRCLGKGRKERCTPLTKHSVTVLKGWIKDRAREAEWIFTTAQGSKLSGDAVQGLLAKYHRLASDGCPSLKKKRVTPHVLRHTFAMELLQAGVDRSVIALWLGHESLDTTHIYLQANLKMKEQILAKTMQRDAVWRPFKPEDRLLSFLQSL